MARRAKATSKAKGGPVRRVPSQERSKRRYEAIVAAAAEAFGDHGFDATTMEGIAARAETSIGSVYQFFPNKRAVFRAVAEQCLDLYRRAHATLLGPDPASRSWDELLDAVIDGFVALQAFPPFRAVWSNLQLYDVYAEEDEALGREFIGATADIIGHWAPHLEPARTYVVAELVVHSIATTLLYLTRERPKVPPDFIRETKLMLRRYLAGYIESPK